MSTGELKKLKVTGYKDERFTQKVGDGEFSTLLNPEKYTFKYKVEYTEAQGQGTSATMPKFVRTPPEDFELDFLFDRTGVIKGQDNASGDGIIDDSGDEHKPNYVMIGWGTLLFKGTLLEMSIEFKLFGSDGTPLRAVAKTKFKGTVEDDLRVAKENNNSPDLTHIRVVNLGDTLPLMTYRIYGDSKYYLEVAKANNLSQFRKLEVGQKIMFPPIEKVS